MLVDMKVRIDTSRPLIYRIGWLKDQGRDAVMESSIAKLYVSDCYVKNSMDAIQVFGKVDNDGVVDRLTALRRAGAAGHDRHVGVPRNRDGRGDIVPAFRDDNADGHHLVDRCIGGVATARKAVEQDFALDRSGKARAQFVAGSCQ